MNKKKEIQIFRKRNKRIKELYNNGLNKAEIARIYNISRQRVQQILREEEEQDLTKDKYLL